MSACVHCGLPVPAPRRDGSRGALFCCFGCRFAHGLARPAASDEDGGAPATTLVLRLGLGIFLAINIMVFSWIFYSGELFGAAAAPGAGYRPLFGLFAYLSMFLCTAVVVMLGFPLAGDALDRLRAPLGPGLRLGGRIDTNLLICIGVGAAWLLSVVHTIRGAGSLYYDTAAMVLVVVTLGQYLEAGAKRRAARSATGLLAMLPHRVRVRRSGGIEEIDAATLTVGDRVQVRAGEAVPADGRVLEGASRIDESSLTGESHARSVAGGDRLLAGTVSLDGALWMRAERIGGATALASVERMLDEARMRQPAIQRVADRVSALFVPGVVLLALTLFAGHAGAGRATHGLFVALSVLLISCPCALGLAAPLAAWSALRRAAGRGMVIESAVTLERAARIRRLFFDKTGTLTERRLQLSRVSVGGGIDADRALAWAASLESASLHPIAEALTGAARARGLETVEASEVRTLAGLGLEGRIGGKLLRLGGERLIGKRPEPPGRAARDATVVYLAEGERALARFELTESLREDAPAAVAALRHLGVRTDVLTGDRAGPAELVGDRLAIPVHSGLLPADKLRRLESTRGAGRPVAFVGDGINDAPVLAAADVGIATGSAADLARQAGNVHLLADRVDRVPLLLALSRHAVRRIRWNLAWAFGYNTVGITLAALGLLTPVFAATAMFVSSLIIVAISRGAGDVSLQAAGLPREDDDRQRPPEAPVVAARASNA